MASMEVEPCFYSRPISHPAPRLRVSYFYLSRNSPDVEPPPRDRTLDARATRHRAQNRMRIETKCWRSPEEIQTPYLEIPILLKAVVSKDFFAKHHSSSPLDVQ